METNVTVRHRCRARKILHFFQPLYRSSRKEGNAPFYFTCMYMRWRTVHKYVEQGGELEERLERKGTKGKARGTREKTGVVAKAPLRTARDQCTRQSAPPWRVLVRIVYASSYETSSPISSLSTLFLHAAAVPFPPPLCLSFSLSHSPLIFTFPSESHHLSPSYPLLRFLTLLNDVYTVSPYSLLTFPSRS